MTDSIDPIIRAICQAEGLDAREIRPLSGGQVNQVFLVDHQFILRIGGREDAFMRLERETDLLRRLAGRVPVPPVLAFGQQDEMVYQIQQFVPGQKLYRVWKELTPGEQETIVVELAEAMKVIHSLPAPSFGYDRPDQPPYNSWSSFLSAKFNRTLEEIRAYGIRMVPGILELAGEYFDEHRHVLEDGQPTLVHGDLTMVNVLVERGHVSAILDFEYSLHAPRDYELFDLELFCLYPNDYAEEDWEIFCAADFGQFFQLLRKHYPALFEIPDLRERVDLYQVDATLGSYLGWRKANLATISPERMAAKDFYMARITNFIFPHGARMFFT